MKQTLSQSSWTFLAVALALGACSEESGDPSSRVDDATHPDASVGDAENPNGIDADGPLDSAALANGFELRIEGLGIVLTAPDGRTLFALSDREVPHALHYEETWSAPAAIWEFVRTDLQRIPFGGPVTLELADDGSAAVRWPDFDGESSAELRVVAATDRVHFELSYDSDARGLDVPVHCDADATFHGFGEQYNATDQRSERFELIVSEQGVGRQGQLKVVQGDAHTTYFAMPYWLDARGHGVLFHTDRRVLVDLCATDEDIAWIETTDAGRASWTVFAGDTPKAVIEQLSGEVGRPARPPAWAWELWIGAQGGRESVLAEVSALEEADIPVGAFWVQDWTGIRPNLGGGFGVEYRWEADLELYPDLAGMVSDLHDAGYRFLVYVNPFVDPALPNHHQEMADAGLLVGGGDGRYPLDFFSPSGTSAHADFTVEEARDYVREHLVAIVDDYGVDGWMADFGEWLPYETALADGSDPIGYHNRYPIEWHRVVREALEEARPDGDWVSFARSGWTGVQSVAQIHWVGDQEADFSATDGLPTIVPAMLNLGLSGQPYTTLDIAGFSGGPSTREVFQRFTELGAFAPIMRTHEGNLKDQNWSWDSDEATTEHFRRFVRIHEALATEIEAWAAEADSTSVPIVRHLLLEFPDDPEAYPVSDQFMLGDALLVAPVVEESQTIREVYLPAGEWYHVWTGDLYEGPQSLLVEAPIGAPPVFSRGVDRPDLRSIR